MPQDHQPHDKFIKQVLSDKSVVKQYIQQFVPQNIVKKLDFRTLKSLPTSFVDEKLKEHISDIVYQCDLKNKKEEEDKIRISFLFEHKSYLPKYPHLQLLRYLTEAWEQDSKEKRPLTITIPIILYHGKKKWKSLSFPKYFGFLDENFSPFIPDFEYLLTDLSQLSDDKILSLEKGFLVNAFLVLKHSREKEYVKEFTNRIYVYGKQYIKTETGMNFLRLIAFYISKTIEFEEDELNLYIEKLSNEVKTITMSTHDMLIKKGIEQGIEQGISKIIKSLIVKFPNHSDFQIAEMTDVDVAIVEKVRKSIS